MARAKQPCDRPWPHGPWWCSWRGSSPAPTGALAQGAGEVVVIPAIIGDAEEANPCSREAPQFERMPAQTSEARRQPRSRSRARGASRRGSSCPKSSSAGSRTRKRPVGISRSRTTPAPPCRFKPCRTSARMRLKPSTVKQAGQGRCSTPASTWFGVFGRPVRRNGRRSRRGPVGSSCRRSTRRSGCTRPTCGGCFSGSTRPGEKRRPCGSRSSRPQVGVSSGSMGFISARRPFRWGSSSQENIACRSSAKRIGRAAFIA